MKRRGSPAKPAEGSQLPSLLEQMEALDELHCILDDLREVAKQYRHWKEGDLELAVGARQNNEELLVYSKGTDKHGRVFESSMCVPARLPFSVVSTVIRARGQES